MKIHNLESETSLLDIFISEMRDLTIQKDSLRFRKNLERVGEILAYEVSKYLTYKSKIITTPLGKKSVSYLQENIVICSVLRAGLTLHQGVLNYFDQAESAYVSAFRKHNKDGELEIVVNYAAAPSLDGKILLLTDPMLATGKTLENVLQVLRDFGNPKQIHILSAVGSQPGVKHITKVFPPSTHLWIASIDEQLNAQNYIVPGLGDAGDLAFGEKLRI